MGSLRLSRWILPALLGGLSVAPEAPAAPTDVAPGLSFVTTSLPNGTEKVPYDTTIQVSPAGAELEVVGGRLPWGLQLDLDGHLHGVPSFADGFSFTVRARSGAERVTQTFTVSIGRWQSIAELPCGASVDLELTAAARSPSTTFDLDLPGAAAFFYVPLAADVQALDLVVRGTGGGDPVLLLPRAGWGAGYPEMYAYTLVEDHPGDEALRLTDGTPRYTLSNYRGDGYVPVTVAADTPGAFTLAVTCVSGVAAGPAVLPNATVGMDYEAWAEAYGASPPFTFAAPGLPAGLAIEADTGRIHGVPEEAGAKVVQITTTDAVGASDTVSARLWGVTPEVLACGDRVSGRWEARAFDGSDGLRTPGAASFFEVVWDEDVTSVEVSGVLDGGRMGLFQGLPGLRPGTDDLGAYRRRSWDEGEAAWISVDLDHAPFLDEYDGHLAVAAAGLGGGGDWEIEVRCSNDLGLSPLALPHAVLDAPYAVALDARGHAPEARFALSAGALPPGLTLMPDGLLSGTPTVAGRYPLSVEVEQGSELAARSYELVIGDGPCGDASPLACDDFVYQTLTAAAWEDRLHLDLTVEGGAHFFCLQPDEGTTEVELILGPVSGSNPDLFVGATGLPPGFRGVEAYEGWSTLDAIDTLVLTAAGWPALSPDHPTAVAVAALEVGGYTLEVVCR